MACPPKKIIKKLKVDLDNRLFVKIKSWQLSKGGFTQCDAEADVRSVCSHVNAPLFHFSSQENELGVSHGRMKSISSFSSSDHLPFL